MAGIMAAMKTEADEIAGELYLVPPAGFVAARDELVRQSQTAGARELARELRRLRRPTQSAWLVNLLVRHERPSMDHLLAVGRELRDAQARLDAARLRRLAGQRQRLIADLLDRGRRRASDAGVRPSAGVLSEVEATLKAALVDLAASSTVLSGRLIRPMTHSGFGPTPDMPPAPAMRMAVAPVGPPTQTPAHASIQETRNRTFPVDDELGRRRARADQGDGQPPPAWPVATDEEQDVWSALSPVPDGTQLRPVATDDEQDVWNALRAAPDEQQPSPSATEEEQEVWRAAAALAAAESDHWHREFELADAEGALDAARERCDWLDSQRFQARRERVTAERHLAEAQAAQQSAVGAVEDARRALEAAERRLRSRRQPPPGGTDS
jgi:hypothetical protein